MRFETITLRDTRAAPATALTRRTPEAVKGANCGAARMIGQLRIVADPGLWFASVGRLCVRACAREPDGRGRQPSGALKRRERAAARRGRPVDQGRRLLAVPQLPRRARTGDRVPPQAAQPDPFPFRSSATAANEARSGGAAPRARRPATNLERSPELVGRSTRERRAFSQSGLPQHGPASVEGQSDRRLARPLALSGGPSVASKGENR